MKKLFKLAVVAVAGLFVYKKVEQSKAEQELWTQATASDSNQ